MRSVLRALVVLPAMSLLVVLAVVALSAMPAEAKFLPSASASTSVSSAVLNPPTNLKVTTHCSILGSTATLSWTPTTPSYATGYTRTYTMNGGASQQASGTIAGTATSTTFSINILTTYTTALTSTYGSWTSQPSPPTASFACY